MVKRRLLIDHDAGVDDLAAIAIATLSDQFEIDAITICPADSYKRPAIQITMALVQFLKIKNVVVAASDNEGVHLFPDKWRSDSLRMAQIPELQIDESEYAAHGFSPKPAAQVIVERLSQSKRYDILVTGPLSNIAEALQLKPEIRKNIRKIFFMGGAFHVHGNVEDSGHDVSAEWNVYNNPEAVDRVVRAGIPIVFVSLDATNQTPVTKRFMSALHGQSNSPVSQLFYKVWSVIAPQIESEHYQKTYFFWDTLTAAIAAKPALCGTTPETMSVDLNGASEGRTRPHPQGYAVERLLPPNAEELEKYILQLFARTI